MSAFKGDFLGFTYNNVHSSALGIVRINEGNRHELSLLPTMQDKTVQIPGGDGTYYFGSYFTQRQFTIHFAFDAMTEEQLGLMQKLFGDKKIHPLVFDESPYKEYSAKVASNSTFKYIPFSEGKTGRVYKGEGSVQFVCYQPYAVCKNKSLSFYSECENISEWNDSAGLINLEELNYDIWDPQLEIPLTLYNPGVKEADWTLLMKFGENNSQIDCFGLKLGNEQIRFNNFESKKNSAGIFDTHLIFDSKANLIEGAIMMEDQICKTGNIYNEYIQSGYFFKIPINANKEFAEEAMVLEFVFDSTLDPSNYANMFHSNYFCNFKYNYYYY